MKGSQGTIWLGLHIYKFGGISKRSYSESYTFGFVLEMLILEVIREFNYTLHLRETFYFLKRHSLLYKNFPEINAPSVESFFFIRY